MLIPKQRVAYILNQITVRARYFSVSMAIRITKLLRRRLPDSILLMDLRRRHREALTKYVPVIYPGKLSLFRATQTVAQSPDESLVGWAPLVTSGMEVYPFEAPHGMSVLNMQKMLLKSWMRV